MRFCRAALPLLAVAVWARAADTIPAELFPPDTQVVLKVSIGSLRDSALLKGLPSDSGKIDSSLAGAVPLAGIDPLKDIDTIVLAASTKGNDARGLVVLRGRFAAARTKGATMYQGVPIVIGPNGGRASLAVLDSQTAIVGSMADLQAAINRRGNPSVLEPALASRITQLNERYDFWSVGRISPALAASTPAGKSLESVVGFELAATLQDGLRFRGEIHLSKPQDAAQLESTFQTLGAGMAANPSSGGTRFDLHAEGGRLEFDLFVPEAELQKALAAQKEGLASLVQGKIVPWIGGLATAAPAGAASSASGSRPAAHQPNSPPTIVNNQRGETVTVTLPPGHD